MRSMRPFLYNIHTSPSLLSNSYNLHSQCNSLPISKSTARFFSATTISKEINGPLSTLPPPLDVPVREPDEKLTKFVIKRGKAYFAFYKTGLKAVFSNFSASIPIQQELDKKYGLRKDSWANAINAGFLDRSKFQLLIRSWHDIWKIPIFAVVFLICGEWTPVIVLTLPSVVPLTSRIPKQVEKERTKLEERRKKSFRELTEDIPAITVNYKELNRPQLLHINATLGLSRRFWDYIGGVPGVLLKRRVGKKLEYLGQDDMLIEKEGGAAAIADERMNIEEVKLALVERGIDVMGRQDSQLRDALEAWFHAREDSSIERLLLTR